MVRRLHDRLLVDHMLLLIVRHDLGLGDYFKGVGVARRHVLDELDLVGVRVGVGVGFGLGFGSGSGLGFGSGSGLALPKVPVPSIMNSTRSSCLTAWAVRCITSLTWLGVGLGLGVRGGAGVVVRARVAVRVRVGCAPRASVARRV